MNSLFPIFRNCDTHWITDPQKQPYGKFKLYNREWECEMYTFSLNKKDRHLFWTNISFTLQWNNGINYINDRIERDKYVIFQILPFDNNVWSLDLVLRAEPSCDRFWAWATLLMTVVAPSWAEQPYCPNKDCTVSQTQISSGHCALLCETINYQQ